MPRTTIYPDISDILQLLENFPINNRLEVELDAKVPIQNKKDVTERLGINNKTITFRDVVNLLTNFIKGIYSTDAKITPVDRLDELRKVGLVCTYPAQYLLFDFCLAALEGDYLDAKLFLGHAIQFIGLSNQFNLLLSAIVYTPLTNDADIRQFLTFGIRSSACKTRRLFGIIRQGISDKISNIQRRDYEVEIAIVVILT